MTAHSAPSSRFNRLALATVALALAVSAAPGRAGADELRRDAGLPGEARGDRYRGLQRDGDAGDARLQPGSPAALAAVREILTVLGVAEPVQVYRGELVEAAALFPAVWTGQLHAIVYNPRFFNALHDIDRWAPVSVLAHEVGHILADARGAPDPWGRELAADYLSGCALARLGAPATGAVAAQHFLDDDAGSSTHPDTPRRIDAIREGHAACR